MPGTACTRDLSIVIIIIIRMRMVITMEQDNNLYRWQWWVGLDNRTTTSCFLGLGVCTCLYTRLVDHCMRES